MASYSSASNTSMSPSQSSATPTAEDDGVFYETEFVDGAPYTRKRPSSSQIGALQASYDANQYPSREERMALADKIDMYVFPFVIETTVFNIGIGHTVLSPTGSRTDANRVIARRGQSPLVTRDVLARRKPPNAPRACRVSPWTTSPLS